MSKKKSELSTCNQCHREMTLGVGISNTNIAFAVLTTEKMYENDDRVMMVCTRPDCPSYSLLQIPAESMPKEEK